MTLKIQTVVNGEGSLFSSLRAEQYTDAFIFPGDGNVKGMTRIAAVRKNQIFLKGEQFVMEANIDMMVR